MLKHQLYRTALGLLALAVLAGHAARYYEIGLISRLDGIIYDAKVRLTMPRNGDSRIVIVNIDAKSLAEIGRWPWNRERLALLVDKAFERYGIVLLGIDMILAEADASSGLGVLESLAGAELKGNQAFDAALGTLRTRLDYDRRLAESMRKHAVVLGFHLEHDKFGSEAGVLPPPLALEGIEGRSATLIRWSSFSGNRPEFQAAALGAGHTNGLVDLDGITRRVPLIVDYQDRYHEALALAMARAVLGNPPPRLSTAGTTNGARAGGSIDAIELPTGRGTIRIPVDAQAVALIPFRGEPGSYPYYSAADLMADRLPADALRGKLALLGTTAPGLLDLRATPAGAIFPGVEVHANLLSGILDSTFKAMPPYLPGLEVTLLVVVAALMLSWLPRYSPARATLGSAAILLLVIWLDLALWQYADLALPTASVFLLVLGLYAFNMSFGYFTESRTKKQLARRFGEYVPPELVEEMSRNPTRYSMEGRSLELTVLFADIRGFASISEGLPAKELAALMNEYFSALTDEIRAQRGTLDKYVGDAIMAFWGAPVEDAQHAHHAVIAGLRMQRRLVEVNSTFASRGWPRLAIGIGINTGVMTVGDMGSRERKAYTVLGDPVNLGSRLEGLTAYYGVGIIIGAATRDAATDIVCRELDRVRVRGRAGMVTIYEPIALASELDESVRAELDEWHTALARYRAQDWDGAAAMLARLAGGAPERTLYRLYLKRIGELRAQPPAADWDGVWQFGTK